MRERIDDPAHSGLLHPCAYEGYGLPGEEEPVVSAAERTECGDSHDSHANVMANVRKASRILIFMVKNC